jgi:hypothetical protein
LDSCDIGTMLKDPASIALAAFFAFLGVLISIYQVWLGAAWRAAQRTSSSAAPATALMGPGRC